MLASGQSMVLAYKALLKKGQPSKIHVVSVIGSQQGIDLVAKNFPKIQLYGLVQLIQK